MRWRGREEDGERERVRDGGGERDRWGRERDLFPIIRKKIPVTDGLYNIMEHHDEMMRMRDDGVYKQCWCAAHNELPREEKPIDYKHWLRQLLRTPTPLQNDTGVIFALAMLEILLGQLGKTNFVAQRSG